MSITTISNSRMDAFLETIAKQAHEALKERSDDILAAWHENMEEATNNEDKLPPLKLSIAATVDLEANKVETSITFTARYKTTISQQLPDPDQMELPMNGIRSAVEEWVDGIRKSGASVSIEAGENKVVIDGTTDFKRKA